MTIVSRSRRLKAVRQERGFQLMAAAVVSCILALPAPARAGDSRCPQAGRPQLEMVLPGQQNVILDHSHSREQIQAMLEESGGANGGEWKTVGLTRAEFTVNSGLETRLTQVDDGLWCASVVKLTLTIGFPQQTILMPDRFRKGSCPYQTVLEHENRHVQANQATLRDHWPQIRQEVEALLDELSPFALASRSEVRTVPLPEINRRLQEVFVSFERDQKERNAALDTEESYRAVTARCNDW